MSELLNDVRLTDGRNISSQVSKGCSYWAMEAQLLTGIVCFAGGWILRDFFVEVPTPISNPCACTCNCLTSELPLQSSFGLVIFSLAVGAVGFILVVFKLHPISQTVSKGNPKGSKGVFGISGNPRALLSLIIN